MTRSTLAVVVRRDRPLIPAPRAGRSGSAPGSWAGPFNLLPPTVAAAWLPSRDRDEPGRRPRASGGDGRHFLELITAMYRAAQTGQTVRRGQIGPGDPFYSSLEITL
ncbi:hypothetical protein ACIBKY_14765 [Nonomuraea sp. NPDC050394]|uniref:hypothetical protein n=1 Tax=Nonomuraea sp. NPDC050394 TaxID=3364363 RepID=UPI0037A885DD